MGVIREYEESKLLVTGENSLYIHLLAQASLGLFLGVLLSVRLGHMLVHHRFCHKEVESIT